MSHYARWSTVVLASALVGCWAEVEGVCTDSADCLGTLASEAQSDLHRKKREYTISTTVDPADGGSVTAEPAGRRARCEEGVCYARRGAAISLEAMAGSLYGFVRWSGCSDSTSPTLTLSHITASAECIAHFSPTTMLLSSGVVGMYRGTVSLSAEAGSCSAYTCSVPYGTRVTLRAPASPSYRFVRWSCSESTEPTLELVAEGPSPHLMCIAVMEAVTVDVTWSVDPSAPSGSVRGMARGPDIVCSDASCQVVLGGRVALEAVPDPGSIFVGWSGCSTSTEPLLDVIDVTEPQHCEARFAAEP